MQYCVIFVPLSGAKKPASESSQFVPGTASDGVAEKTKRLLSAATAGVATSTPDIHDDLGLFIDPGNNAMTLCLLT
jgi:hypothetical protein